MSTEHNTIVQRLPVAGDLCDYRNCSNHIGWRPHTWCGLNKYTLQHFCTVECKEEEEKIQRSVIEMLIRVFNIW